MWEPRPLTPLWAFTDCYRDSFTFFFLLLAAERDSFERHCGTKQTASTGTYTYAHFQPRTRLKALATKVEVWKQRSVFADRVTRVHKLLWQELSRSNTTPGVHKLIQRVYQHRCSHFYGRHTSPQTHAPNWIWRERNFSFVFIFSADDIPSILISWLKFNADALNILEF
jgi:hypothetical protein